MKPPSDIDGGLMGDDVAQLVSNHTGQFVLALSESDHLAGNIDSAAGNTECVYFRQFHQVKAELHVIGR